MNSSLRNRSISQSSPITEWSTLGTDILREITKRLDDTTRPEILRLRAVCKGWRSSIPFPPIPNNVFKRASLPLEIPFLALKGFKGKQGHLLLKQDTIYSLEPLVKIHSGREVTSNWFVKIEETDDSGKVILKDPLSRMTIKDLGNTTGLPKVINLLDYRVRDVGKEYHFEFVLGKNPPVEFTKLKKVVVGKDKNGEYVVMVLHINGKLAVWKMGEDRWVEIDNGSHYKDIIYHKGRFYAVDRRTWVIAVDCSSLEITQVALDACKFGDVYLREYVIYLVKSGDDLYLVNKYGSQFKNTFKLKEKSGMWVSNFSSWNWLVDRIMFVGSWHCSYSFSAREFPGCKENCIYYRDDCFISGDRDMDGYPGSAAGVYDFSDYTARPLKSLSGYSQLFWPPPHWLKQTPS
ncbi:F-box protein SKIP23 [Ziziphus jujuba]|uniref:F-box protein SKIP23 n=1 Tax=Ziziphus jujuba TaxID=326968 RepID=A0ABM3IC08_ZIZJJ|nr:F-box protein SKIP23 [Ziziphus jujuba]